MTRWMKNTNWLAECAIEAGDLSLAKQRLEGVTSIVNSNTRIFLEANALLSICLLRKKDIEQAKKYIKITIESINNVKSDKRRRQFQKRFINRIEEECILSGLIESGKADLNVDAVQEKAVKLLALDKNSLILQLASNLPEKSIFLLENVRNESIMLLPPRDQKFLPPPKTLKIPKEVATRANAALKRVTWRAVCDPNDEIYQAWSSGLSVVYDKKWITAAIIGACKSWKITTSMIVTTMVALAFKMGVKVFCDVFFPESIMISLKDKE